MIKPEQSRYIDSQIDLYSAIYDRLRLHSELGTNEPCELIAMTNAIYKGYILSDIEDKITGVQIAPKIVSKRF